MGEKNVHPMDEYLKEKEWFEWMDALETNWLVKIASIRIEYQKDSMKLHRDDGLSVRYHT